MYDRFVYDTCAQLRSGSLEVDIRFGVYSVFGANPDLITSLSLQPVPPNIEDAEFAGGDLNGFRGEVETLFFDGSLNGMPGSLEVSHVLLSLTTAPTQVTIDVKPGNKKNNINPRSKGKIWVAVLSGSEFDALQTDIPSVRFGPDGAEANRHMVKDVNRDGMPDLLLRFKIQKTGIACGDTKATLTGAIFGGIQFAGTDAVKTVGCN